MSAAPVILLTGADGQVGWELRRALAPLGRVAAVRRADADLADEGALRALVREVRPAAVVNAAAYTAVDRAETERALAFAVNGAAPGVLAEEAARLGVPIVHYSTDYVFDGGKGAPYTEDDPVSPLGAYGESKLAGDRAVMASGAPHLILRTSWVYAARGRNFLRTMLRLAHEREELRVVADQRGVPTPARLIAEVTAQLLGRGATGAGFEIPASRWGVHNLAARGETTWHEFAETIVALDPRREAQRCRAVTAITTAEFPTPARRPACSVLDPSRLERAFALRMPEWRDGLALVMGELGPA
ncbi:MAG TPA: dTDP-4-dehydrorhamnose reductase [Gemmatimonadaceae bacterium]